MRVARAHRARRDGWAHRDGEQSRSADRQGRRGKIGGADPQGTSTILKAIHREVAWNPGFVLRSEVVSSYQPRVRGRQTGSRDQTPTGACQDGSALAGGGRQAMFQTLINLDIRIAVVPQDGRAKLTPRSIVPPPNQSPARPMG